MSRSINRFRLALLACLLLFQMSSCSNKKSEQVAISVPLAIDEKTVIGSANSKKYYDMCSYLDLAYLLKDDSQKKYMYLENLNSAKKLHKELSSNPDVFGEIAKQLQEVRNLIERIDR